MRTLTLLLLVLALSLAPVGALATDLVLVVNARSGVDKLTRDEAINIFMGRYRQLPSGIPALPIDQPASQPEKAQFYARLVGKELAEIQAYWARLIFSGKTSPPRQATSTAEVLEWLNSRRGAIGYLDRSQVDSRVKVVMSLEP